MHNAFAARTYIVGIALTNEFNMASYFPEVGNLNSSNAGLCSDVAGPTSSGSGDLFEFQIALDHVLLLFPSLLAILAAILDLSMTTMPFWACYIIMRKVY